MSDLKNITVAIDVDVDLVRIQASVIGGIADSLRKQRRLTAAERSELEYLEGIWYLLHGIIDAAEAK